MPYLENGGSGGSGSSTDLAAVMAALGTQLTAWANQASRLATPVADLSVGDFAEQLDNGLHYKYLGGDPTLDASWKPVTYEVTLPVPPPANVAHPLQRVNLPDGTTLRIEDTVGNGDPNDFVWVGVAVGSGGGTQGPQGPAGVDGADGAQGIQGPPGQDGVDGTMGLPGLPGADGQDGADGDTPTIGVNGNWFIGGVDTGVTAEGQDGADGTMLPVDYPITTASLKTFVQDCIDAGPANQPPTVVGGGIPDQTSQEGVAIAAVEASLYYADPDGTIDGYAQSGLPAGLAIDATTGQISGTPDAGAATAGVNSDGVYTVTVTATDNGGESVDHTFTWTVTTQMSAFFEDGLPETFGNDAAIQSAITNGTPIVVNGATLATPTVANVQAEIVAAGGTVVSTAPFAWTGVGNLPVCTVVKKVHGLLNALQPIDVFADTSTRESDDGNGGGTWKLGFPAFDLIMDFVQTTDPASANSGDLSVTPSASNNQLRIVTTQNGDAADFVEYDMTWRIENRRDVDGFQNAYDIWFQMRLIEVEDSEFDVDDLFIYNSANGIVVTTASGQTNFRQSRTAVTPTGSGYLFYKSDGIDAGEGWGTNALVGGVDRPVPGDGPFSMTLKLKEGVTFDWRVIERLPVSSTKCGDTFIAAEGHDGTSYNETQFSEKTLRIFNFGDSTTLQSAADFDAALSTHNVTSSTVNARDTTATVNNVASWLTTPEPFDVIRWNNGYWDAQPLAGSGLPNVVTPPATYGANLATIVGLLRQHSPNARIIFSTTPEISANRASLDPQPDFTDYATYNQALSDYRDEAIAVLTPLGVEIDDAWLFYQTRSPTDFGLPLPTRSETGPFWKWDGVHFDESYRQFEGERVADLVRGILV